MLSVSPPLCLASESKLRIFALCNDFRNSEQLKRNWLKEKGWDKVGFKMVAGAFPVFKLISLGAKQLSKPIANAIKSGAKQNPLFKKYFCVIPGQGFHWLETTVKMRLMGHVGPSAIKPLNEEVAVNLAAELLGEGFLFAVGVGTLFFEYRRGVKKDEKKENEQNRQLAELEDKISEIGLVIETQSAEIRELNRIVQSLRGSSEKPGQDKNGKALKT